MDTRTEGFAPLIIRFVDLLPPHAPQATPLLQCTISTLFFSTIKSNCFHYLFFVKHPPSTKILMGGGVDRGDRAHPSSYGHDLLFNNKTLLAYFAMNLELKRNDMDALANL